jgi:CheY-like chemotaxis protein
VEDNPNDVFFIEKALRKLAPQVDLEFAADGDAAVDFLTRSRPSHVLLDLKLPRKTGLEVLEWIRGREELVGLPVVILTSSNELSDSRRSHDLGVDSYRVKPVSYSELVHLLQKVLAIWGLLPPLDSAPSTQASRT